MEIFKTFVFLLLCGTIEAKKRSFCNAQTCNKCAKIYVFGRSDTKLSLVSNPSKTTVGCVFPNFIFSFVEQSLKWIRAAMIVKALWRLDSTELTSSQQIDFTNLP